MTARLLKFSSCKSLPVVLTMGSFEFIMSLLNLQIGEAFEVVESKYMLSVLETVIDNEISENEIESGRERF